MEGTPVVVRSGASVTSQFERDVALLERWRNGDSRAGMELLAAYRRLFYRVCQQAGVTDPSEILEIHQDVVLDLMERLPSLPGCLRKSFAGFFGWRVRARIARTRQKKQPEPVETPPATILDDVGRRVEIWEAVIRCWDRLPPREHEVFELRYLRGLSLKEIAHAIGSNVNAVGQSIFRLSRKMRECMGNLDPSTTG